MAQQLPLFPLDTPPKVKFPSTRYQGSKRKLVEWIGASTANLKFSSVLDVFGGTGVVSHYFKQQGKQIFYNDVLRFNWWIGVALIENSVVTLTDQDVEKIILIHDDLGYPSFIQDTFEDIYFTKEENAWLDRIIHNINHQLTDRFKQALAWFALFQSCMIKRPYNLFHRANLYMREASVQRSFGNKTT
jgi:adenine-specific DNA-methyltransferase